LNGIDGGIQFAAAAAMVAALVPHHTNTIQIKT
jgi:hypothetical protein